jgi:acyl carrier protein
MKAGVMMHATRSDIVAAALEAFIRERFQVPETDGRFDRRVNLWDEGYVDSMGVVEIIEYLEQSYRIKIPEEVLFSPDFTHIEGISSFVVALEASAA